MSDHRPGPVPRNGRAAGVFSLLLSAAGLMMMWTWTGGTVFAIVAGALAAAVVPLCLGSRHQAAFEVIGGPMDGARLPPDTVGRDTEVLVLPTPDGGGARYAVTGLRSLVYRGQAGTAD
ncbi:hypothetical protein H4W79_002261 [Nocardiopsis terrae]|uniref:DUF58 domain-containing protein n=1 Tax=Nocardiopsis terrae TaxID=372655 RepID=A0ABR9HG76_9ACTN|nr:hypothetical protein [Nocardiopsis terrae]MBE1458047.1 hypothetical protein [Nocardiopsis terrae]